MSLWDYNLGENNAKKSEAKVKKAKDEAKKGERKDERKAKKERRERAPCSKSANAN